MTIVDSLGPAIATPTALVLAAVAAFLVGLSKGGLPVVGMLSVPVMALAMPPVAAAALILPIYVASDAVGVWLYRRQFSRRNLAILIPAGFLGCLVGWLTVSVISERAVTLVIGAMGLAFCLQAAIGRGRLVEPRAADVPRGVFWGTLAGLSSFITHAGAPPFQMYVLPQRLEKLDYAGTATILFAAINLIKLGFYAELGAITVSGNVASTLLLAPVAILAAFVGAWATRRINDRLFFVLVQLFLFLSSALLLWKGLAG